MFNNVLGLSPGKLGVDVLPEGKQQLATLYRHVSQIQNEKVTAIDAFKDGYKITTNKKTYVSKIVVLALNLE